MTPQQKTEALAKIVRSAQSQLGQRECPLGSNWGGRVPEYLKAGGLSGPASWCLCFALWNVEQAVPLPLTGLPRTGYCPAMADWARQNGRLVAAADVLAGKVALQPGWILLVWETDPLGYHHAGIVEEVLPMGAFTSVEGNSNSDGGREGIGVFRQHRSLHQLAADGRAKYAFVMSL